MFISRKSTGLPLFQTDIVSASIARWFRKHHREHKIGTYYNQLLLKFTSYLSIETTFNFSVCEKYCFKYLI